MKRFSVYSPANVSAVILTLFCALLSTTLLAQTPLKPTRDQAVMTVRILHPKTKAVYPDEWVKITSNSTNKVYEGRTDATGSVKFLVPNGQTYTVHLKTAPDYMEFSVGAKPYLESSINIPYEGTTKGDLHSSTKETLVNFKFQDFSKKPVQGELFLIKPLSGTDTLTRRVTTNEKGIGQIKLPRGLKFRLSLRYYANIDEVTMEKDLDVLDYEYEFISSKQTEARRAEQARLLAEREAAFKKSLEEYKERCKPDVVFASTLGRNKNWKNKLFVVDVTGSMFPYMEDVITYFKLNYKQGDPMQVVAFNDGDSHPDGPIGRSGGVYLCSECTPDKLSTTMAKAATAGYGGAGPENNLEALREALTKMKDYTDVIMVADNYADVRDMVLLPEIKKLGVPVKIVLCGLRNTGDVNECYLDIAFQTGGSVHTIEGDIYEVAKTLEGEKIKIKDKEYILKYGRFVPFSRL